MVRRWCFLIYLIIFLSSSSIFAIASSRKTVHREVLKQIDEKLKSLNKPAVKTIKSEDGDIIDCVDIYKQPAFDDPAMKNHVIQMKPSWEPIEEKGASSWPSNGTFKHVTSQVWRKSGSCPEGTIPIRRIRRRDLLRASSVNRFGMKNQFPLQAQSNNSTIDRVRTMVINNTVLNLRNPEPNRSDAILITYGYNYIGASGDINIWNPKVDLKGDYTTGQIWLLAGYGEESIEAGWIVNPSLYGDTASRLFIHWTRDGYNHTGCFDLTCTGFVQVSREIAVGAAVGPMSGRWAQYYISLGIFLVITLSGILFKDTDTEYWWLQYGPNRTNVGYWPAKDLFHHLPYSAIYVQWGGEVYSEAVQKQKTSHTGTAMGSGEFAESLYGVAAFVNHARIVDWSRSSKYPLWVGLYNTEVDCYNSYNYREGIVGEPMFFFGGPGRNYHCP